MKRLLVIPIILSMFFLSSCGNYTNIQSNQNYSSLESKTDILASEMGIESILERIDNNKPYNDIITETVDIESFTNYIKNNPYNSIKEFDEKFNIECLRKVNNRKVSLYSVHKTENNGLIYVFFGSLYRMYGWYYVEKPLKYKDFKSIKKGISTIEDVEKIDSAATIYKNLFNDSNGSINHAEHYLNNGILLVSYKKENGKFIVDEMEYSKKFMSEQVGFEDGSGFEAKILDMDFIN